MTCAGLAAHVELENSRDHDNGLRTVPVLEHCKFHCFSAVDEQAAKKTSLILDDPVAAAVFANQEERGRPTTRRGRFTFVHDTSPLLSTMNACCYGPRGSFDPCRQYAHQGIWIRE